ncbi:alpha/beta hydrolase [Nocardia sp. NPDC059228]|uniref:alpha/beta hydrolase n=1 Tax=Nocardia sp. NPDC059228 TaxID=3346777 RepID=UPI003681394C
MTESKPDTIVLIHGIAMTPLSWEHWVPHYEAKGFKVLTPAYPGIEPGEAGVAALRKDPSPLAGLGTGQVVEHLQAFLDNLDTKPIIMGHSFGGIFVQLLLDAGYGSAGVSIDGGGTKGVKATPLTEIKAALPVVGNPANKDRAVTMTEEQFHYAFTNNLTDEESKAVYDRYAVAVAARMIFQTALANVTPNAATTVDYSNDDRAPLLFIAGGHDHILPHAIQHENYKKWAKNSTAITAYELFEGRDHFTCGEPGWEDVADFALEWALNPVAGELPPR